MSKHMKDFSGENHPVSNDVFIVSRGEYKGKMVRIVLDSENVFGDSFSSKVEVCFAGSRYMECFTVSRADLELI